MPFVSIQQQRWAHTEAGTKALGGKDKVHEWDEASKGKALPKKVPQQGMSAGAKVGMLKKKKQIKVQNPTTQ